MSVRAARTHGGAAATAANGTEVLRRPHRSAPGPSGSRKPYARPVRTRPAAR